MPSIKMQNNTQLSDEMPCDTALGDKEAASAQDKLVEAICKAKELPALGSSISRLVKLSSSVDGSIQQLTEFVLSDVSLTQKILRIANSVNYRMVSGQEVTKISGAIQLLGLDAVRNCALAIVLVDNMPGKHVQCVRQELAHAQVASAIGRELAKRIQFKDAEEVAIATLFKNMGCLLVAAYDHKLYWQIMALVKAGTHTSTQASTQILGCSFDQLTETVLRKWQIPDTIMQAMEFLPATRMKSPKTRLEWMQQVVAFSETVTPTIMQNSGSAEKNLSSEKLLARFSEPLRLNKAGMNQLLDNARKEAHSLHGSTGALQQTGTESVVSTDSISTSIDLTKEILSSELMASNDRTNNLQIAKCYSSGKPYNAYDLLMAGIEGATKMSASNNCSSKDIIMLFLEIISRSLGFRFATICLNDSQAKQFKARCSLGEENAARQSTFYFPAASSQDLFHLAMDKNVDLFISDASDIKIRNLIPRSFDSILAGARSFLVMPLVIKGKPLGFFYADRDQVAPEGIKPNEMSLVKLLKGQVLTALSK
jgi:HD-like signal output (HDOD) protein